MRIAADWSTDTKFGSVKLAMTGAPPLMSSSPPRPWTPLSPGAASIPPAPGVPKSVNTE